MRDLNSGSNGQLLVHKIVPNGPRVQFEFFCSYILNSPLLTKLSFTYLNPGSRDLTPAKFIKDH
jgi:hypothetical protein